MKSIFRHLHLASGNDVPSSTCASAGWDAVHFAAQLKELDETIDKSASQLQHLQVALENAAHTLHAARTRRNRIQWAQATCEHGHLQQVASTFATAFEHLHASTSHAAIAAFECDCAERERTRYCECFLYSDDYGDFSAIDEALDNFGHTLSTLLDQGGQEVRVLDALLGAFLTYFGTSEEIRTAEKHSEALRRSYLEGKEQLCSILEEALVRERIRSVITEPWRAVMSAVADEDQDNVLRTTLEELELYGGERASV